MFDVRKIQEQVLFGAIAAESDAARAGEIVFGVDEEAKSESNAQWVESSMCRLESSFDEAAVKKIRMSCQCGYGMDEKIALVKELMKDTKSMEEFANSEKARAAGLYSENGELYLQFFFCPCPMLSEVKKLKSKAWCYCSAGYSKVLFETAFGCPVDVELLKSIKAGDDVCLMKIILRGKIWD